MRLGFSVAMHVQPDVLLLDEVLAVGDEAFQQKCFGKIGDFKRAGGTIVFVSHDPGAVERLCDQAVLLDHGRSVERGSAGEVVRAYHRRLVSASHESADGREGRAGGPVSRARGAGGGRRRHRARALQRGRADGARGLALRRGRARRGPGHARPARLRRPGGSARRRPSRCVFARGSSSGCGSTSRGCRCARVASTSTSASRAATAPQLDHAERALELSVFGQDPGGGGAIRLGGTWELPAVDGTADG